MPLEFRYHDPQGEDEPAVWVSLSSNSVPFGTLQLSQAAELGEAATSGLEVEDPDGTWDFVGLRALSIYETSAPSNNQVILRGRTQDRSVSRGDSELTGAARVWSIDLVDYNFHLGKRIHVDSDAKRPAESAGDRLRWLLNSAAHIKLHDHGNVTYPSQSLDACDYRGQRPLDLLADCAVEGGYNFWCEWREAHNCSELYFLSPNSTNYESTARISNDLDDADGSTFYPNQDARLTRSPSRIAFGVYLPYANGAVYVRNTTTRDQFTDVDQAAPMSNVKREARARRIATKFLNDHDEEEDKVTCSIWVPAAQVNDIRAGHRLDAKFTHFPGWEAFRPVRVLRRTVAQDPITGSYIGTDNTDADYRIDLELVPIGLPVSCSVAIGAADAVTETGWEEGLTATVTSTAAGDGSMIVWLIAENSNSTNSTNMSGAAGYTELYQNDDESKSTYFIGYQAASDGQSYTATTTWTGGYGPFGVWAAGQVWLPLTVSVVQQAHAAYKQVTSFPAGVTTPTPGNIMLMFCKSESDATIVPGGGGFGPTTGWTRLFSAKEVRANCAITIECYARCVAEGEGTDYGWSGGGGYSTSHATHIVELAV